MIASLKSQLLELFIICHHPLSLKPIPLCSSLSLPSVPQAAPEAEASLRSTSRAFLGEGLGTGHPASQRLSFSQCGRSLSWGLSRPAGKQVRDMSVVLSQKDRTPSLLWLRGLHRFAPLPGTSCCPSPDLQTPVTCLPAPVWA